ncbi:MAG: NAD(P)-dependent oxidoreductase [Terriglobales bacterium]
MSKPRVAILGVGLMGSGMAGRLLSASFPLSVYNRNREKAQVFADAGAFLANSPREAVARSEIIISMLVDDGASRSVWFGDDGALAGASPGAVLIESSTVTVGWIKELAAAATRQGCELLDAPVTGSKPQAASGELRFLVGGDAKALEIARPVLSVLGNDIIHFGPNGSGAVMKLINNFMSGVQAASLAEATAFIQASGLDREKALAVLTNGAPGSPLVKLLSARAKAGDFTPNFVLRLMAKDLSYAIEEGRHHQIDLRTAAGALAVFQQAIASGYGEKDFSAVIESSANAAKAKMSVS